MTNNVDDIRDKVEDIHTIMFEHKRSDTLARQEIQGLPLKPEIFHGRGKLVKRIAKLFLQEKTSRVCILGPGGMGKTSVSLAVVETPLIKTRFPGRNCVWVPCIEATSATLLLEILCTQLQVSGDGDKLEKIITELNASKHRRLILLDNFETPWNASGKTQKQVGDILRTVATRSHVAILVTMRGTHAPCDTVGGSRTQSNLLIKQRAVVFFMTSIRVRRMTPMLIVYWLRWATCLSRSHSWPIWGSEGSLTRRSYWRRGTHSALTCSLLPSHPKKA